MKKILFTEEQTQQIIKYYTIDIMGMSAIGKLFNVDRIVISRILKENGIKLDTPGQRFKGGRQVSNKRYIDKNKTKLQTYHKKWVNQNRENLRIYHKQWRDNNKEHVQEKARMWINNKINSDVQFKINQRIRTALWQNLKENNIPKYQRTFEILPFTLDALIKHLESQFTPEMTWDNYGDWHIDHIKPLSSFKFISIDDSEFLECWSLTNLRPMWSTTRIINGVTYYGNLNKGKHSDIYK